MRAYSSVAKTKTPAGEFVVASFNNNKIRKEVLVDNFDSIIRRNAI